ncbi:3-hydroxyacyl-CoA dehydrogenase [Insolitispirillum peregrinum]|uniref:3-hydroxyacyl-CoA dehydrogenase n=1 Tax=Insolitispirillum peregrinum TaxID=80876 RepID=UPI0036110E27
MSALPLSTPVAVVGAGAMGSGIAHIAARAGHPVFLYDSRPGAAADAVASQRASFATLAQKGKLDADTAHAASAALQAVDTLDELAGAGLVIEAIIEDLTVKQELFRRLEAVTAPDCILASNTSSLSITAIASALDAPQRLAGLHFFNPAPLMALVEVVSGLATAPAVVDTLMATAQGWGKTPVRAGSTPGFIVNRVARPYYAEALRLLDEQVSDTATLDALYRDAGGFRMGPFELMDLIGHDVNFAVTSSVWRAFFHDPRFTPSLIQQELVAAGFLGRKSGRGFYDYRGGERPDVQVAPHCPAPNGIVLHGDHPATAALTARLQAHGVACQHQSADDDRLASVGSAVLYPTDGRTAAQRAASSGIADTAVLDLALDYRQASRLAMTCAPHCTPAARQALTGLLQAAGIAVSWLADSPALAVMRTVAMLANEAGDAVHHGVCSAAAADTAMRLGANYPCGPLAWADRIGVATVVRVLDHLAAYYGEDRYRLSPYLRSCLLSGRPCHA